MKNIIWNDLELNPAISPTYPANQDDFGNTLNLPNQQSINASFVSGSTYGGSGSELAFSEQWRQSRSVNV